jgi:hypothetical protein
MRPYFTRERFGRPQGLAGLLLLAFLAQAVWLVHLELAAGRGLELAEGARISEGLKQWHGEGMAGAPFLESTPRFGDPESGGFDREHSPLPYMVSAAPLLVWPHALNGETAGYWRWLPRLPFLAIGVLLGASLWYVARRLCGNTGGLIALTLYCFSPSLIQASAVWHTEPEILAAWGAFGAVFTAIAVAHTLYAPREVVLWNWRRIVLLGVSFAIAVGAQFSMIIVVPIALVLLLYVAPVRKGAGLIIWLSSLALGAVLLFSFYFFHPTSFAQSMRRAAFWGASWKGFAVIGVYEQVAMQISRSCPALIVALPVALLSYALWPRTRYFGNTAPGLLAVIFLVLGMAHPHVAGAGFILAAIPFLFIYVSGTLADLLETAYHAVVSAAIAGLVLAYVAWIVLNLSKVPPG